MEETRNKGLDATDHQIRSGKKRGDCGDEERAESGGEIDRRTIQGTTKFGDLGGGGGGGGYKRKWRTGRSIKYRIVRGGARYRTSTTEASWDHGPNRVGPSTVDDWVS